MDKASAQIRSFIVAALGVLMLLSGTMANAGSSAFTSESLASPHAVHDTVTHSLDDGEQSIGHALPGADDSCIGHGGHSGACCAHSCVDFSALTADLSARLFGPVSTAGIEDSGLLSEISLNFSRPPNA